MKTRWEESNRKAERIKETEQNTEKTNWSSDSDYRAREARWHIS